jgi:hypothetical protein
VAAADPELAPKGQGFQGAVTAGFSGVLEGIDVGNRPIGPWKPENPHESAVTAPWKLCPEGAQQTSPGQRPEYLWSQKSWQALKGRNAV